MLQQTWVSRYSIDPVADAVVDVSQASYYITQVHQ